MSLTRHPSVLSPFELRSCSVPNFFCTFADDEEHPPGYPPHPEAMKFNWKTFVVEVLRAVIAALAGGTAGMMM